jgi:GT2 family glycosyltransferase
VTAPIVSVLIPTWNNAAELVACLTSLRQADYPRDRVEVVVFDNGSTDDTGRRVRECYAKMEPEGWRRLLLERSARNLGAFGGRAEAARLLDPQGDLLLSLDDDVELAPDALVVLVAALADPRVGVVGARIVYHDAPEEVASAAGYINRWLGTFSEAAPAARTPCDFVSSCGCLVRRAAFDAVGGFDGEYFTSHGDVDLCLKVRALGLEVLYEPGAVIRHKVARGGTRSPERVYYGYRNKLLLLRKHVPAWWRPGVFALYGALWLPRILAGSVGHHGGVSGPEVRAILRALRDAALDRRGEARRSTRPGA